MASGRFNTRPTPLLDASDLADLLGLSDRRAVYKRMARGTDLPRPLRIGTRSLRWRPEDVADWLDGLYAPADGLEGGGGGDR